MRIVGVDRQGVRPTDNARAELGSITPEAATSTLGGFGVSLARSGGAESPVNLEIEDIDIQVLVLVPCGAEGFLEGLGDFLGLINALAQGWVGSGGGTESSWKRGSTMIS